MRCHEISNAFNSRRLHHFFLPGKMVPRPSRLFIHQRCARLVECSPSLQHEPDRPGDVLKADGEGIGGDDTADALRYLIPTKERKVTQRKLRGL